MRSVFDGRYRDLTNFTSDEYLHINSCGVSRSVFGGKPRTTQIYRPDGRVDYHFLLVVSGSVTAVCGAESHELTPGDGMFYRPHDPQDYSFSVSESVPLCQHLYVHFCGTAAEEIISLAGLTESAPVKNSPGEVRRILEALIRCHHADDNLTACGQLLRLIALLSPKSQAPQSDSARLIRAEAEYISSHYTEDIDLDACAARCNLSRSRFTHLFAQVLGVSPHRYQQRLQLEQARELLGFSTLSVNEISESLGFQDPLYFSRLFKKSTGASPSEYRKK